MGETTKLGLVVACVVNHKKKTLATGGEGRTGASHYTRATTLQSGRRSRHCRDSNKQLGSEAPFDPISHPTRPLLSRLGVGAIFDPVFSSMRTLYLRPVYDSAEYIHTCLRSSFCFPACFLICFFSSGQPASHTNISEAGDWR